MIIDQKTPLRQVAEKYGATKTSVYRTFKRDAEQAGVAWPIKRDLAAVHSTGIRTSTVDGTVIADLVQEAYRESGCVSLRRFATQIGITEPYLSRLFNGKYPRISKPMALRLLRAVGEDPHPALAAWKPLPPSKKGSTSATD